VQTLATYDDNVCASTDLNAQWALTAADVDARKSRANASLSTLCELALSTGGATTVTALRSAPSNDDIAKYAALVVSECRSMSTLAELNDACRAARTAFIVADAPGVFGAVFCDVGEQHTVLDVSGERAAEYYVASIAPSATGGTEVTVADTVPLQFDGASTLPALVVDRVRFGDVRGASELNALPAQRVILRDLFKFELPDVDARTLGTHEASTGVVTQVPAPVTVRHTALVDALELPLSKANDVALRALFVALLAADDAAAAAAAAAAAGGDYAQRLVARVRAADASVRAVCRALLRCVTACVALAGIRRNVVEWCRSCERAHAGAGVRRGGRCGGTRGHQSTHAATPAAAVAVVRLRCVCAHVSVWRLSSEYRL
jgi:hypothetical protein